MSLRAAAFPATMLNFLSPHTQSMHSTVPSQILSFGWSIIPAGRTSQKRLEQGPKIDPFPSPHHQTTPPLPLTSGPWPHHVLYWLVAPGPCACFPLKFVQEAACCSCVCRDLETFLLRFSGLLCGLSFDSLLQLETGLRMMMGFIFLVPTFVFLCCLPCWLIVPAVMTQSC